MPKVNILRLMKNVKKDARRENTCCITGYKKLWPKDSERVKAGLQKEILQAIEDGYTHFLSDFDKGVPRLSAAIVLELKKKYPQITLEAALPYLSRFKGHDKAFRKLFLSADILALGETGLGRKCFVTRGQYMVLRCERVISVQDKHKGEADMFIVGYARLHGRELRIIEV